MKTSKETIDHLMSECAKQCFYPDITEIEDNLRVLVADVIKETKAIEALEELITEKAARLAESGAGDYAIATLLQSATTAFTNLRELTEVKKVEFELK